MGDNDKNTNWHMSSRKQPQCNGNYKQQGKITYIRESICELYVYDKVSFQNI